MIQHFLGIYLCIWKCFFWEALRVLKPSIFILCGHVAEPTEDDENALNNFLCFFYFEIKAEF